MSLLFLRFYYATFNCENKLYSRMCIVRLRFHVIEFAYFVLCNVAQLVARYNDRAVQSDGVHTRENNAHLHGWVQNKK